MNVYFFRILYVDNTVVGQLLLIVDIFNYCLFWADMLDCILSSLSCRCIINYVAVTLLDSLSSYADNVICFNYYLLLCILNYKVFYRCMVLS